MRRPRLTTAAALVAPTLTVLIVAGALALAACGNKAPTTTGSSSPTSAAAVATTESGTPLPTATGPGTIAFIRVSGSGSDVYTIRTDGTGLKQLTNTPENENMASWSPDGKKIAFVRWLGKKAGGYAGVYDFTRATVWVMNADGSHQQRLTRPQVKGAYGPAWSPDGRRILLDKWEGNYNWNLAVMNADGSGLTKLTDDPAPRIMTSWAPDGRIFFNDGPGMIYSMNADGSGLKPITYAPGYYSVSPDGKWLAISDHDVGQLLLAQANGRGEKKPLMDLSRYVPDAIVATSWSPDGSAIALAAAFDGKGPSALYILRTDGSVRKVPNTGRVLNPAWRPQ